MKIKKYFNYAFKIGDKFKRVFKNISCNNYFIHDSNYNGSILFYIKKKKLQGAIIYIFNP